MWEGAMPTITKLPYPNVLIDILGLGGSSKTTNASHFRYKQQADSIAQILDEEGVGNNVIPIGHDWGSAISQRFYLYHRDRCVGLCLLALAYVIPTTEKFDLDEQNKITARRFGYPQWEYWNFFTAPDAPKLMEENLDRMWAVNNGDYPSNIPEENGRDNWMREMFDTLGAMREYVAKKGKFADYTVPLKPYKNGEQLKQRFIDRMTRDGFSAPVCYYHSLKDNHNLEDETALCQASDNSDKKITVPMLYIGCTGG